MARSEEQHPAPAVSGALENLGWNGDDLAVRDGAPPVSRGGNVVAVLPPAPAWASPLVAALLDRPAPDGGRVLILASPATLGEWTLVLGALAETGTLQVDTAWDGEGASVRTAARPSDVLIASPESALARHGRSALHPDTVRAVVFAWPEQWVADEAVTALLQDIPKDAQRLVLTARRDLLEGTDSVVERYARKALVVAPATAAPPPDAPPAMSVRTVATSWAGRAAVVAGLVAANETPVLTIWTADRRDHQLIRRTLGSLRPGLALHARTVPQGGAVICYDLPAPQQLAALSVVGEVTLLVPPGTEDYVNRVAPTRRPLTLRSAAQAVADGDTALRARISERIERGASAAALYAIAPLFERFDAQLVASAVLDLWRAQPAGDPSGRTYGAAVAPGGQSGPQSDARAVERIAAPRSTVAPVAKLWIGAGKKDDATVADFVAVLVREVGLERSKIGRIELRDTFALVEVPAAEADAIATRLSGITIRKRKLTARVDGGRGAPPKRR